MFPRAYAILIYLAVLHVVAINLVSVSL